MIATAHAVLAPFLAARRCAAGDPCREAACPACLAGPLAAVLPYLVAGRPVEFVLPAFPAKSPNRTKVLGPLPDMAERLALAFLAACCAEVRRVYAPGARVILCSDGHVFADQVGVPDGDVDAYLAALEPLLGPDLALFSLVDAYPDLTPAERRARLIALHGRPLPELRAEVRAGGPAQRLFNGLDRFMREDRYPRAEAKARAYRVLQRSQAWGGLVGDCFPAAVRLSIHPQPAHAEKLGIHLLPTHDDWLTPWHGVALESPQGFTLTKRRDAEALGAKLIYLHGQPSHYQVST